MKSKQNMQDLELGVSFENVRGTRNYFVFILFLSTFWQNHLTLWKSLALVEYLVHAYS